MYISMTLSFLSESLIKMTGTTGTTGTTLLSTEFLFLLFTLCPSLASSLFLSLFVSLVHCNAYFIPFMHSVPLKGQWQTV